ncbi:hypothetical protein HMPREF0591_1635 [Mycobacterium parascrofulaceum ATCC BAA-614]|uniref:Uncharacterized protein n=1 Tax=Mycobacterium parascrofulaceum ATCC BAA-614 TaxID=525368 RepID=D5P641_9MYCO|nr:hypothetical protein HMPREF0591_1635 [Mycobacterium parascrofulaceum ATCC BAA-614]
MYSRGERDRGAGLRTAAGFDKESGEQQLFSWVIRPPGSEDVASGVDGATRLAWTA